MEVQWGELVKLYYDRFTGIGGIGTGLLFHSPIVETLGRNESRLAELSDAKDYCKLHIVFHYIAKLLAPPAQVIPIGFVGNDAFGRQLTDEMAKAGMDVSRVLTDPDLPTAISICLQYPDKDGCNFTASNSAGQRVTPAWLDVQIPMLGLGNKTIVAAIPEVSVESRVAMLQAGRREGAFCALSVPVSEAATFQQTDAFRNCDLLAVNLEEAIAISGDFGQPASITQALHAAMCSQNSGMRILVTCGKQGAYSMQAGHLEFIPPMPARVINTTGAGDACLGGTLAGIALGLPFQKKRNDSGFGQTSLESAVELGVLCAGMAIESVDTLAHEVDPGFLRQRMRHEGWTDLLLPVESSLGVF